MEILVGNHRSHGDEYRYILLEGDVMLDELIHDDKHANSILLLEYIIAGRSIIK